MFQINTFFFEPLRPDPRAEALQRYVHEGTWRCFSGFRAGGQPVFRAAGKLSARETAHFPFILYICGSENNKTTR
ncbi:hypothetical protein [uncultured Alistipes sp.]|uniref:hypothetical protein n=1 Tax=uncultured Alistipes sp. TaxID=538949 RepID=UPI0026065AC5|nr:hypothetical protein [uncultured Alistipes sp.]